MNFTIEKATILSINKLVHHLIRFLIKNFSSFVGAISNQIQVGMLILNTLLIVSLRIKIRV